MVAVWYVVQSIFLLFVCVCDFGQWLSARISDICVSVFLCQDELATEPHWLSWFFLQKQISLSTPAPDKLLVLKSLPNTSHFHFWLFWHWHRRWVLVIFGTVVVSMQGHFQERRRFSYLCCWFPCLVHALLWLSSRSATFYATLTVCTGFSILCPDFITFSIVWLPRPGICLLLFLQAQILLP